MESLQNPAVDFRHQLAKGKRLVLKRGMEDNLSDDDNTNSNQLLVALRSGLGYAELGLVHDTDIQQMSMVVLFDQFHTLFDLHIIQSSIRKSFNLVKSREESFLELYLSPDECNFDDLIWDLTGEGIMGLSAMLKAAPLPRNCYGKIPQRQGHERDKHWHVPLVYICCRMVLDVLLHQLYPPTIHEVVKMIDQVTSRFPFLQYSKDAGVALFLVDLIAGERGRHPKGLSMTFLIDTLQVCK
jgi:hypothetical protein